MTRVIPAVILEDVVRSKSEDNFFSWSVLGNPIGCEVPEEFKGKAMEICVTWGISPGYTVTANLLGDVAMYEVGSIEVETLQDLQALRDRYPKLFQIKGTFYIM